MTDMWVNGAGYESYIGRWSRLVARQFLNWLDVPSGARWLDVGCGTGILSQTILDVASPQKVLGIDSSDISSLHASTYRIHMYLFD